MKSTFRNKLILGVTALAFGVMSIPVTSYAVYRSSDSDEFDMFSGGLDVATDDTKKDEGCKDKRFPKSIPSEDVPNSDPKKIRPKITPETVTPGGPGPQKPLKLMNPPQEFPADRTPGEITIEREGERERTIEVPNQPNQKIPNITELKCKYKWKPATGTPGTPGYVPGSWVPDLPIETTKPTTEKETKKKRHKKKGDA